MAKALKKQPLGLNNSKMNSILSTSLGKKGNKSLVDPDGSGFIQLSQSEVNFINTEPNEVYEISFTVRNVGQKSTKLKIRKPKSDYLAVSLEKDINLAPGLDKKITVTFNSQINEEIKDRMFLYYQDEFDIEVPICVFPNLYQLAYQPFINFGFLKIGSTKSYEIRIENKGTNVADIRLEPQIKGAKAVLEPSFLTVQPKGEDFVTLYLSSQEACEFEGSVQIFPQNLGESCIQIVGSFCQHSRYISDFKGKEISQLHIQALFGGQRKKTSFNLVNNTPKACQFRIIRKKSSSNDEKMVLLTPQEFGRDDEEKNITFSEIEGEIPPYSKKQITCDILVKVDEHDQQLFCNYISGRIKLLPYDTKEWLYMFSTTFKDEDSAKNLVIRGESIIPKLSISSIFFKFGDCNLRSKQQKILKIENLSDRTVPITLQKSQNYSFFPQSLEIPKDSSKEVVVKFFPKVVGDLHQLCYLKSQIFSFPLKMFGKGIFVKQPMKKTGKDGYVEFDQSRGVELNVADMDKTIIEDQISIINEKSIYVEQNSKISTTNYDSSALVHKNKTQNKVSLKKKSIKNKLGKQVIIDIQNFNPDEEVDEYPGLGKNSQEDRVVLRELTLSQFKNIPVGPVILDFGQIFVSSARKKTFHICNLNPKPISIQVETKGNPQFQKSNKQIQVLPGESHGGLKIIYEAMQEGPFKHHLQYVINGRHYFEMVAVGTAILPTILPSKTQFRFVAGEDDHTFEKKQVFTLNNAYPYEVQYSFQGQKQSLFKVSPSKGKLDPKGRENICISHSFFGISEGGGKIEENLKLKVKNGRNIDMKCISVVPDCYVICRPNECNFKQISICKTHEIKFSIKNSSKNFTVFKVIPNKEIEDEVKIVASKTILATDQIAEITLKLISQREQVIDSGLTIIVRGGKKIFIPVKANIFIPKIKIEGDEINFGAMPVGGNPTCKQITLSNQSSISAQLELVLSHDSFLYRCLSLKCDSNQLRSIAPPKQSKQRKAKIFQIKIMKKCKAQICLQFSPQEVRDYKFALPLYLAGNCESNPALQKSVICRSLKNRLLVDYKELDFGKTIIEQSLDNLPKSIVLTLSNPQQEDIEWWASEKNLQPFSLEVKKGLLKGNSQIKLKVYFYSENPGTFEKQLQFFVNNSDFQPLRPYLKLPIKATANYPEIYFDRPYLILPTVRLNQESSGKFQILNGGYENLNLKHVVNEEYANIDLSVKYINGCNLGITKKSITVAVTFKSDKPISFTLKIDFYDHHNRVFSIFVSGTADCSLYAIPNDYWLPDPAEQIAKSASFITTFLNSLGFVEDMLGNFPNCLMDNDFENFHKLLEYLGSQTDRIQKLRPSSKKSNTVQQSYEYLSESIKLLKSDGAFLSEIRPQFLVSEPEYIQLLKLKSQNQRILSNYKLPSSEQMRERNLKSWIILIYQVLRVYSRVPLKKKPNNSDIWSQMLQKQKIIINWLEQCYQAEAGLSELKSSNELSDLSNGEMLSALMTKYTNIKILESYGKTCNIFKQKQKRCRKIIEIFSQIGIPAGAKVQDLLRSKPVEMIVFLQRLYMILPYYLQKGDPIIFTCAVGQSISKTIEIKNPSKFPVAYVAKIEGSKAYIIENEQQFEIQSKQRHEIHVKYISNIDIEKSNATLTLTGKTTGKFTPSTFIFVLKSAGLGRISQKNIQISGQLYEPYQFQLNIKNNFPADAAFNVEIISTTSKIQTKNLYCTPPLIKAKKDENVSVSFVFFPFMLETHKFQILFKDPKVGEFQYDLVGLVDMPQVISEPMKFSQQFFTNKSYAVELVVPFKNQEILRARKQIDVYIQKINRKAQTQFNSQGKKTNSFHIQKNAYPLLKSDNYSLSLMPQTDMVVLKTTSLTLDPEQDETSQTIKKICLDINMKMPAKQAPIYLIMKSSSGHDIRCYKILITSVLRPLRYELQMKIPLNQSITQPLPLINISDEPNVFNVTFISNEVITSRNAFTFNNQKDITVKAKDQATVNLTFTPKCQQHYTGLVKIENVTVGQVVEYEINGLGEEPVAETLKYDQKTGEIKRYELRLPFVKPQKCVVTKCTFHPKNIKYEKYFSYNNETNCVFKFDFFTKIPGIYEGKIYLEDEFKIHAFNINISVSQNVEGVIEIKSTERMKKQVSLQLEKGTWKIEHSDPCLLVPDQIEMAQPGRFTFSYVGSKAGQTESELIFKNQSTGYLKYLLKISIEQQPETVISGLKVELGKAHQITVRLENPDPNPITITGSCSNIESFFYQPEGSFIIAPKSFKDVKFVYRPTCLQAESGKLYFTSNNNLKWKYELSGFGCPQAEQEVKQIDAEVGEQIIETINFVNPFKKSVFVYIFLQSDDSQFKLINKSNKQALDYLQEIEVPIKFTCCEARRYSCRLKIVVNQKIYWKYVINVRTIYKSEEEPRVFKLPARAKKELTASFCLSHLSKDIKSNEKLKCILTAANPALQQMLKNSCRVMRDWEPIKENKLEFLLNFLSYRPFVCPFYFEIYHENNCKWVFKGEVEYTTPLPDDQFEIVSQINKATSVMFRLNNRVKSHAKFKAYFTSDSDMEFSIFPKSGDLQPYGREGSQFEVTFAPTQYKNSWHGKIVIETDESYWSYIVKGNLPHYFPPIGKSNLGSSTIRRSSQ